MSNVRRNRGQYFFTIQYENRTEERERTLTIIERETAN